MKRIAFIIALSITALYSAAHTRVTVPYAVNDTSTLYMDIYTPDKPDPAKPAVLYMFGGGFMSGNRRDGIDGWFKTLNDHGYSVVSIDYRLGLKGAKLKGLKFIAELENAIDMAVLDLFSATAFLLEKGGQYGIDAHNLVLTGSSAGAISVLQAEYEICNRSALASMLPDGFNYAGIMSFSGAIFDDHNPLRFPVEPCPLLLFHGIDDKLVPYKKIAVFNICFGGTDEIVRLLKKNGYHYTVYRYVDRAHEVSVYGEYCTGIEFDFLENVVVKGDNGKTVDTVITDPASPNPAWGKTRPGKMYK